MTIYSLPKNALATGTYRKIEETQAYTRLRLDTQEEKNQLLISRLHTNLSGKSREYIEDFCINEIKAISTLISAHGDLNVALTKLEKSYEIINPDNLSERELIIDHKVDFLQNFLGLFSNRKDGLAQKNANRVGGKYVQALLKIIALFKPDFPFSKEINNNINSFITEASGMFYGMIHNHIKNVNVNYSYTKDGKRYLEIKLGRKDGTMGMGDKNLLQIELEPYKAKGRSSSASESLDSSQKSLKEPQALSMDKLNLKKIILDNKEEFGKFLVTNKLNKYYDEITANLIKLNYPVAEIMAAPHKYFIINLNQGGTLSFTLRKSDRIPPVYSNPSEQLSPFKHQSLLLLTLSKLKSNTPLANSIDKIKQHLSQLGYDWKILSAVNGELYQLVIFNAKEDEFQINYAQLQAYAKNKPANSNAFQNNPKTAAAQPGKWSNSKKKSYNSRADFERDLIIYSLHRELPKFIKDNITKLIQHGLTALKTAQTAKNKQNSNLTDTTTEHERIKNKILANLHLVCQITEITESRYQLGITNTVGQEIAKLFAKETDTNLNDDDTNLNDDEINFSEIPEPEQVFRLSANDNSVQLDDPDLSLNYSNRALIPLNTENRKIELLRKALTDKFYLIGYNLSSSASFKSWMSKVIAETLKGIPDKESFKELEETNTLSPLIKCLLDVFANCNNKQAIKQYLEVPANYNEVLVPLIDLFIANKQGLAPELDETTKKMACEYFKIEWKEYLENIKPAEQRFAAANRKGNEGFFLALIQFYNKTRDTQQHPLLDRLLKKTQDN